MNLFSKSLGTCLLASWVASAVTLADKSDAGAVVFDPGRVAIIRFTMTTNAYATMMASLREANLNSQHEYVPADLQFDGQTVSNIAVRLKGFSSLASTPDQPSLKVDFNRYVTNQAFDGLKKLNIHSVSTEESRLADYLSYAAWRDFGVAAPRTGWADVWINGTNLGTYTTVEQVDQGFLSRHFDYDRGDLYKPVPPTGELDWEGSSITNYVNIHPKLQEDTDHSAFIHLVDVLNHESATNFHQVLDLKGVLTYFAGNVALGNGDVYPNNYYLYENSPGKFTFLPWDMNQSQTSLARLYPRRVEDLNDPTNNPGGGIISTNGPGGGIINTNPAGGGIIGTNNPGGGTGNTNNPGGGMGAAGSYPITDKLLTDPAYQQIYLTILKAFLEGPGSKAALSTRIDDAVAVLGDRLNAAAVAGLRSNITARVDGQRERLYPALPNPPTPRLFINEMMAVNKHTLADEAGEYDDWIELFNPGGEAVDMSGMFISDKASDSRKWEFPTNTVIPANGYLLLWADEQKSQGPLHLNFKLASKGETISLYDNDRRANMLIDSRTTGAQSADISEGCLPDGSALWLPQNKPTPGAANDLTDTDQDGLPDAWETAYRLNPQSSSDAHLDGDGDGVSNLDEYLTGTNPKDANSVLKLDLSLVGTNLCRLSWTSETNKMYRVQRGIQGLTEGWQDLGLPTRSGPLEDVMATTNGTSRFYRLIRMD